MKHLVTGELGLEKEVTEGYVCEKLYLNLCILYHEAWELDKRSGSLNYLTNGWMS